jgi:hypothetical protein
MEVALRAFEWRYGRRHACDLDSRMDRGKPTPNVVASWRAAFDEIPDCAVKVEAWQATRTILAQRGQRFAKPFTEPLPSGCQTLLILS